MTAIIEVNQITKSFGTQQVLKEMNFSVKEGEIVGLLGPNGSGKTTMIRLLNGVITPDSGFMSVGGYDPIQQGDPIRQMSGIVTEGAGLYHELSGVDNLRFFAKLYGVEGGNRIDDLLKQFDLTNHQHKLAGTYSTGMKKRLGLAKALLHQPELLFLDEPTNGLDPDGIQMVIHYLTTLNKEYGTTILLCSHVLHQVENVCHSYIFMEDGQVIIQGNKREIEDRYLHEVVLRVETGLNISNGKYAGYPVTSDGEDVLVFTLPAKDHIPNLLRQILSESWIYSTDIMNRDLESLYFQVRGGRHA